MYPTIGVFTRLQSLALSRVTPKNVRLSIFNSPAFNIDYEQQKHSNLKRFTEPRLRTMSMLLAWLLEMLNSNP